MGECAGDGINDHASQLSAATVAARDFASNDELRRVAHSRLPSLISSVAAQWARWAHGTEGAQGAPPLPAMLVGLIPLLSTEPGVIATARVTRSVAARCDAPASPRLSEPVESRSGVRDAVARSTSADYSDSRMAPRDPAEGCKRRRRKPSSSST